MESIVVSEVVRRVTVTYPPMAVRVMFKLDKAGRVVDCGRFDLKHRRWVGRTKKMLPQEIYEAMREAARLKFKN